MDLNLIMISTEKLTHPEETSKLWRSFKSMYSLETPLRHKWRRGTIGRWDWKVSWLPNERNEKLRSLKRKLKLHSGGPPMKKERDQRDTGGNEEDSWRDSTKRQLYKDQHTFSWFSDVPSFVIISQFYQGKPSKPPRVQSSKSLPAAVAVSSSHGGWYIHPSTGSTYMNSVLGRAHS